MKGGAIRFGADIRPWRRCPVCHAAFPPHGAAIPVPPDWPRPGFEDPGDRCLQCLRDALGVRAGRDPHGGDQHDE